MKIKVKNYINEFGSRVFLSKLLYHGAYKSNSKFAKMIIRSNENLIKNKIRQTITDEINDCYPAIKKVNNNIPYNSVIWIMWWQGIEDMPDIVRACVNRIEKLNNKRHIVVITKYNYKNYIKLEPKILKKFYRNKISITHLSDIIRVNLLYVYGGVWIDATIFELSPLPDSLFTKKFFTIKTGNYTNDPSHGLWTTFFMESQHHNKLMGYLVQGFNTYCLKYDEWIDYILFDYFIRIIYEDYSDIRQQINDVPINNQDVFKLRKHLNDQFNYKYLEEYRATNLFKLSYKGVLNRKTKEGKKTVYLKIIE